MNNDLHRKLQALTSPHVHYLMQSKWCEMETDCKSQDEIAYCAVDSKKCRNVRGLFETVRKALKFPYPRITNWHAFDECLADMEWMEQYRGWVLVFLDAEQLLPRDTEALKVLIDTFESIGQEWSEPRDIGLEHAELPRSFHFVFSVGDEAQECRFATLGISALE
ncbi:MAG: barstar family protein [Phycisphaerales bacterium]|nr:barstar family protein [Phycisphaerales bacterium]MCB9857264.1 barstar family protein [Phycisphaerales bacterium]MCB9863022.1 barstar family protein [Phycisphaerales bacterium]